MNKLFLSVAILSTGCYQYGPARTEEGKVIMQIFHPAQEGTTIGVSPTSKGMTTTVSSVSIPATYGLIFQCSHGQFAVTGNGDRYKHLWERLPVGTSVLIQYRERYYHDGEFAGMDFLDARPRDLTPMGDFELPTKNYG